MGKLDQLKQLVFESDNNACFIERDRILQRLESELPDPDAPDYYAQILSALLAEVSTPVLACDYFVGRVVEALPEEAALSSSSGYGDSVSDLPLLRLLGRPYLVNPGRKARRQAAGQIPILTWKEVS